MEIEKRKMEAMRNKPQKAVKKREDEGENPDVEDSTNRFFTWYDPVNYDEASEKYGIVFCDSDAVRKLVCLRWINK